MTKQDRVVEKNEIDGQQPVGEANDEATATIVASEEALEEVCKATRSLIRRSYQASRIEIVGRAAMHYIDRRETRASANDRPFYGKQMVQTIRRYTECFVAILRYIWRTEAVERRPKYHLTSTQENTLAKIRKSAANVADVEKVDKNLYYSTCYDTSPTIVGRLPSPLWRHKRAIKLCSSRDQRHQVTTIYSP